MVILTTMRIRTNPAGLHSYLFVTSWYTAIASTFHLTITEADVQQLQLTALELFHVYIFKILKNSTITTYFPLLFALIYQVASSTSQGSSHPKLIDWDTGLFSTLQVQSRTSYNRAIPLVVSKTAWGVVRTSPTGSSSWKTPAVEKCWQKLRARLLKLTFAHNLLAAPKPILFVVTEWNSGLFWHQSLNPRSLSATSSYS